MSNLYYNLFNFIAILSVLLVGTYFEMTDIELCLFPPPPFKPIPMFVYTCQIFIIDVKYLTFFDVSARKKPLNFRAL